MIEYTVVPVLIFFVNLMECYFLLKSYYTIKIMVKEIIRDFHKLLASSIRIPHSYLRRSRGFVSELKFKRKCEDDKIKYLDGGWIFFKGGRLAGEKQTVYVTTTFDAPDGYKDFYEKLSRCPLVKRLFFLKIEPAEKWGKTKVKANHQLELDIPEPLFDVYEYKDSKFIKSRLSDFLDSFQLIKPPLFYRIDTKDISLLEYLDEFSEKELSELYCARFVVDYLMKGRDISYGMDFDGIIIENGKYFVVETKEKDPGPSNRNQVDKSEWFFGWDTLRIVWYLYLIKTTDINCYSTILEINNQTDRKFVAWKRCELLKLCRSINYSSAIAGGIGMGTTKGSTTIAPYSVFEEF